MARATKDPVDPDDAPLKRLGGGRWQTRDERFTIEPQSGTWVVVDGEQTDELGLPLVRGPFASLTSAKAAIAGARADGPAASPLAAQIERRRRDPVERPDRASVADGRPRTKAVRAGGERTPSDDAAGKGGSAARRQPNRDDGPRPKADESPREPSWLADLEPAERGRARRLMAQLAEDGVADTEGIVRRDVAGGVPAVAARAIAGRLEALGPDASPAQVAEALADGRDERLGVRWRLVDGEGRPIVLEPGRRRR
jgi:hypothetical protein